MTHPIEKQVAIAMKPVIEGYRQLIEAWDEALAAYEKHASKLKPCPVCGKRPRMKSRGGALANQYVCSEGFGPNQIVHLASAYESYRRVDAAWNAAVDAYEPPNVAESYRRQLEEAIRERGEANRECDRLMERAEALSENNDRQADLIEELTKERNKAIQELLDINAELAISPTGTLAQAVRLLQRECTKAVRSNRALEATVEAYQRGTGTAYQAAVKKLTEAIETMGRLRDERDGYKVDADQARYRLSAAVTEHGAQLLAVANALGSKTTGGLVELARSVKAAADGFGDGTSWVPADQALRVQQRCAVLEKRLAAIRATADGKADA